MLVRPLVFGAEFMQDAYQSPGSFHPALLRGQFASFGKPFPLPSSREEIVGINRLRLFPHQAKNPLPKDGPITAWLFGSNAAIHFTFGKGKQGAVMENLSPVCCRGFGRLVFLDKEKGEFETAKPRSAGKTSKASCWQPIREVET